MSHVLGQAAGAAGALYSRFREPKKATLWGRRVLWLIGFSTISAVCVAVMIALLVPFVQVQWEQRHSNATSTPQRRQAPRSLAPVSHRGHATHTNAVAHTNAH
jgi:hypothetical protein